MRQHANSDTFNWMSLQSHWKPDKTLYTVVLLWDDGESVTLLTHDFQEAWKYAEQNKENLLYFWKQLAEPDTASDKT